MTHQRTVIRQYIATAIDSAGLVAADRVYQTKTNPHESGGLPAIELVAPQDTIIGKRSDVPKVYIRGLIIEIDCIAGGKAAEDDANDLSKLIEDLLLPDHSVGGLAEDVDLESTVITVDSEGYTATATASMVFLVTYITEHPYIVDDTFNSAHADWDLAEPDGQIDAQDILTLPQ
ncbi:MAG: hypothetical protein DRQ62_09600 [Gammaproteobacteria bacterium]|nr:MAG: hypothetical protein DRQ62_09600 [Gammaproteobacteria bacterium]